MLKHEFTDVRVPIALDNPSLKRIESLCINCGLCKNVCEKEISIANHFSLEKNNNLAICINCGQCIQVCPTKSLVEKQAWLDVEQAIHDKSKTVVVMTSPSVRVALQEEFGLPAGKYYEKEMVGALRALGVDIVLDTTFAADLTIMEEANELVSRIQNKAPLPQFTSCCPAWVKFIETYYPNYIPNLSTAKSPIGMFGPMIKTYFAKKRNLSPKSIVTVALTPCTAKKYEIQREEMKSASIENALPPEQDTNYVITTKELANWLKARNLDFKTITPSNYDTLMERGSGAGVIFGNTGGVMEAALRYAYFLLTNETPSENFYQLKDLHTLDGIKIANLSIKDIPVKIAVIHGTDNARKFLAEHKDDLHTFTFIEVMTCRGGCISGGGQPIHNPKKMDEIRQKRIEALTSQDANMKLRLSHENPDIKRIYEEYLESPLSEIAHRLLHTSYTDRSKDLNEDPSIYANLYQNKEEEKQPSTKKELYRCTICGYIYEGDITKENDDYVCPLCYVKKDLFEKVED